MKTQHRPIDKAVAGVECGDTLHLKWMNVEQLQIHKKKQNKNGQFEVFKRENLEKLEFKVSQFWFITNCVSL